MIRPARLALWAATAFGDSVWAVSRHPATYRLIHAGHSVEVTYKNVIHIRLRVLPPDGRLAVSVPFGVAEQMVRAFLDDQRSWIARAQQRVRLAAPTDEPVSDGGRVLLWGRWREVRVTAGERACARLSGESVVVTGRDEPTRRQAVDAMYRRELTTALPELRAAWEHRIGRGASQIRLRRMKTRWGTCNTVSGAITLNLALAEHPPHALEYVLVHELVHLWERGHGLAFTALMDRHLPDWRARRAALRGRP